MKKDKEWIEKFSKKDQYLLNSYFEKLNDSISLSKKDTKFFIKDFENAIDYYYFNKININIILKMLSLDNIADFYKTNSNKWYPLDYAAKIYPLSMKHNWMAVFRMSVYLKEDIIPEILQIALTFTIKRFPTFAVCIRKGFFWHYLEGITRRFSVHQENDVPCSCINISNTNKKTFRTLYYKNRMSVEFFHVLTDGYGASIFIKTLASTYLKLLGKIQNTYLDINEKPKKEELSNDFIKYNKDKKAKFEDSKALQIDGKMSNINPCQIIHFELDENEIISYCKSKNITVTNLILAFIFKTLSYVTSKNDYIKVQVPVNIRKFYNSTTLRNFSLYTVISIKKNDINNFEDLLLEIKKQLKEKVTEEEMNKTCVYTNKIVNSIRYIPLFIKAPIAKIVYGFLGEKVLTTTLSNLGHTDITNEMSEHIEKMDFVLGTSLTNRVLFSLVSCNKKMNFTITKATTNTSIERILYKELVDEGFKVKVTGSEMYEDK